MNKFPYYGISAGTVVWLAGLFMVDPVAEKDSNATRTELVAAF